MATNGRAAYGVLAERFALSLSPVEPVIVFDQGGAAEALRDCAARRFDDQTFYVRPILPREYAVRTDAVLPSILASFKTSDDRRFAVEQAFAGSLQVNNQMLRDVAAYAPPALRLMQAALRLADGIVVSSEAERRRALDILLSDPPSITMPLNDPTVPQCVGRSSAGQRDAIVIWAPHLTGDAALAFVLALTDLRINVLLVSGSPPADATGAHWVPADRPGRVEEALSRAKVIIDTSAHGCDAARGLGSWNVPIVADAESGAQEILNGVKVFDRQRFPSIFEAVVSALGSPIATPREDVTARIQPGRGPRLSDGPLVSIVIPTYDRPKMLSFALESVRRQTYRNIETIVVVDGGPRLDELASSYPDVSFLHMPENNPLLSSNTAFAATRGEYVAFLNDDDLFFPDHVAELVSALERSGQAVAHSDVLTAFLRGNDEEWILYGLESNMSRAVGLSSLLVSNQIGMTSCMFRRACIRDEVPFEEAVPLYRDYALWLRLANDYDFVHVERLTSCYTIRNGGAQQQSTMWYDKALKSYEVLYNQYAVPGRPRIERSRQQVLQSVTRGDMGIATAQPAGEVQGVAWPLWRRDLGNPSV